MSITTTSLSFKGVGQHSVASAIVSLNPARNCFVSPKLDGWVTVFDEACEWANEPEILNVSREICLRCNCPAVALAVIQSSLLFYWMIDERGEIEDRSYFEARDDDDRPVTRKERKGLSGEPERLARLAKPGVTGQDLREALERERIFPEENLDDLSLLLGIEHYRALYRHLEECWDGSRNSVVWNDDPEHQDLWPDYVRIQRGKPSRES